MKNLDLILFIIFVLIRHESCQSTVNGCLPTFNTCLSLFDIWLGRISGDSPEYPLLW